MSDSLNEMHFEEAYTELEALVRQLENGDQPLAESVALYERGRLLAAHCQRLLEVAELRVTQVDADET